MYRPMGVLLVTVAAAFLLPGCEEAAEEKTYAYEVEVSVTGSAGNNGISLDVVDESSGETIVSRSDVTSLPLTESLGGEIDYSSERPLSVTATAGDLPDGESFSVEITYTEKAYTDPISYTIEQGTSVNTAGGSADTSYRTVFVLPYQPEP